LNIIPVVSVEELNKLNNNQDSHVKLFEKIIFVIDLKRTGFTKNLRDMDQPHIRSTRPYPNYRLQEFLKNSSIDFYNGKKYYGKRYT